MPNPYYEDSTITIYHGDSREIIPCLEHEFDLLFTDPPYGTEGLTGGYGRAQNHGELGNRDGLIGFRWFGEIVWNKATPGLGYTLRYQHESAMVFTKGEPNKPPRAPLSLVTYPVSHVDTQERHPHEKPVDFWHNAFFFPGAIALDPFCGSGNMLRAAKNLGRRAVGIEGEERWCEQAARSMQQQTLALGGV